MSTLTDIMRGAAAYKSTTRSRDRYVDRQKRAELVNSNVQRWQEGNMPRPPPPLLDVVVDRERERDTRSLRSTSTGRALRPLGSVSMFQRTPWPSPARFSTPVPGPSTCIDTREDSVSDYLRAKDQYQPQRQNSVVSSPASPLVYPT